MSSKEWTAVHTSSQTRGLDFLLLLFLGGECGLEIEPGRAVVVFDPNRLAESARLTPRELRRAIDRLVRADELRPTTLEALDLTVLRRDEPHAEAYVLVCFGRWHATMRPLQRREQ